MPAELSNIIWTAVGIVISAVVTWLVGVATVYINRKIKDKKAANFLSKILNIIGDAVKQIFQEFVEVLKKEGRFDEAKQKEAKERALKIIKSQLTPELIEFIKENFDDVEEWLKNQIEVAIYNFKK